MEEIRTLFRFAKDKVLQCIGNIKSSLPATSSTTNEKKYTTVSIGQSVFTEDSSLIQSFVHGFMTGIEEGRKAFATGNYLDYAASLFQDLATLSVNSQRKPRNNTVSKQDEYLLSFLVIQSQNSLLYHRAFNLLHKSELLCNGVLDGSKDTVDSTILDQKAMDSMYESLSGKLPLHQKIAFRKTDSLKTVSKYSLNS